jgi:hypothetical protein
VVYLTEQPSASFREALRRANLLRCDDLIVLQYYDTIGIPWKEVVEAAYQEMKRRGARLLVVDTLPQFAGLKGDTENSSGNALEAIQPLQAIAAQGMAVLIIRHDRKAGGDVGDSARGSSAFGGAVDIILSLRRGEGNSAPTVRVIQGIGRFDATPDKLVIDYRGGQFISLGTETQVVMAQARDEILEAIPEAELEALSADEILKLTDTKATVGRSIIKELLDGQVIERKGKGKAGSPFRYWRVGRSLYGNVVAKDQPTGQGDSSSESRLFGTTHIYSERPTLIGSDADGTPVNEDSLEV